MVFDIYTLVEVTWILFPIYAANGLTPVMMRFLKGHPIDNGRMLGKNRLLGDGKSWEGLFFGTFMGIVIAVVEMLAFPYLPWDLSPVALSIIIMTPLVGFLLGFGAMMGDVVASFFKRRMNRQRGALVPLLDQLDFLAGAFLMLSLVVVVEWGWIILGTIITLVFHVIANVIAFKIGVKKTPW